MQLMKIIQVTDTHLMPRGTELNGLSILLSASRPVLPALPNTTQMQNCASSPVTSQIVVILDAYNDFRNIIQNLSIPYYPLIGNHDHREIFCEVFPHVPRDEHGFVQQMLKTTVGRFLLLDTV